MNYRKELWGGLILAAVLVCGCGQKRIDSTQTSMNSDGSIAPMRDGAKHRHAGDYRVHKHDTLWAIAGKHSVYGDSFEWPLIFKTNRDKIQDPDLIYPNQEFKIQKVAETIADRAKKLGEETPKYVPHSTPNKTLPVDYF